MADGRNTPDLPRGLIDRRGTPLGKGARLPSIKGPRDLTLGGIPKKVFTPKIPVRKTEQKLVKLEEQTKAGLSEVKTKVEKDLKKQTPSKTADSSQRKYKGRNVIHTHSIFEDQGSSKSIAKTSARDPESLGGRFSSKSATATTTKKFIKSEVKDDSTEVLDYLLRDDFIDGTKKKIQYMEPVHLPLSQINLKKGEQTAEIKEDPDGDTEMTEVDDRKHEDTVLEAMTKSDFSDELLFFQFPDCLPGMPTDRLQTDDDDVKEEVKPAPTQMMTDFSEGSVGRLVIRKSGKAQLIIGNVTMDVSMGTKCNFLQDVVSIHTSENSGRLSVLGHIKHRLVCTPDFDSMLDT